MPQGSLPIYDKDVKVPAVTVSKRGRVPDTLVEGERVTVPLFEIASYPQVRFSQAKARRFNLIDRAQQRAKNLVRNFTICKKLWLDMFSRENIADNLQERRFCIA